MIKERHTSLNSTAAGCSVRHTRSNTLGIESSSNLRGKKPFLSFTEYQSTHVSFPTCLSSPTPFPAHLQLKQAAKEFLLPRSASQKPGILLPHIDPESYHCLHTPRCFQSPPGRQKNPKHPKQSNIVYTNCLCKGRWT